MDKTKSTCPLVEVLNDNNCEPFDYEQFHDNFPSELKLTSRKQTLNHLNTESVRDDILEVLVMDLDYSLVPQEQKFFDHIVNNLEVDLKGCKEIEKNPRGQADCPEWYCHRKKRLTAQTLGL